MCMLACVPSYGYEPWEEGLRLQENGMYLSRAHAVSSLTIHMSPSNNVPACLQSLSRLSSK